MGELARKISSLKDDHKDQMDIFCIKKPLVKTDFHHRFVLFLALFGKKGFSSTPRNNSFKSFKGGTPQRGSLAGDSKVQLCQDSTKRTPNIRTSFAFFTF